MSTLRAIVLSCLLLMPGLSFAQSTVLDLPRESQHAVVTQRIGVTDISISYSRPLVRGRQIWDHVVPYGEVWRAGANENTTITFADPVAVEGTLLPRGSYGMHMIPSAGAWTVIFSKIYTAFGSFGYDPAEDALRIQIQPQPSEFHEALVYEFNELAPNSAVVTMRWDKIAVPFKISVNVNEFVEESLRLQMHSLKGYAWQAGADAADYLVSQKTDLPDALKYIDVSLKVEERPENLMTKSRVLHLMGKDDEAKQFATRALEHATVFQLYDFGRQLQDDGRQNDAFEVYRFSLKNFPDHWLSHAGMVRVWSARGDFDNALREAEAAIASGGPGNQRYFQNQISLLKKKIDINK
jgi:tetratricopeptide (TPR) repeat protein